MSECYSEIHYDLITPTAFSLVHKLKLRTFKWGVIRMACKGTFVSSPQKYILPYNITKQFITQYFNIQFLTIRMFKRSQMQRNNGWVELNMLNMKVCLLDPDWHNSPIMLVH